MRKVVAGFLIGLTAAATVLVANAWWSAAAGGTARNPLDTIELKTYDWRMARTARPDTARKDIALVAIDEYSLRNLEKNAGRWPWPRAVHSMLIDYLARAPAKVIAYDVDFADPDTRRGFPFGGSTWSGAESDQALVDSVKAAGNVILLADATYEAASGASHGLQDAGFRLDAPGILERRVVFPPFAKLAAVASGLGHNLFMLDADGPLRHTVPFVRTGRIAIPSLGLAAALRQAGIRPDQVRLDGRMLHLGNRVMPLQWRHVQTAKGVTSFLWGLINFHGPALLADLKTHTYPTYSFYDLEYSEEQILAGVKPNIDPSVFRNKIVFVGVTATGLYDVFETPFAHGRMPGIQVHAAVADDLLSGRFMWPASRGVRIATVLGAGLLIGVAATMVPAWWATGVALLAMALFGWVATRLFAGGYWLNVTQPGLTGAFALFGGVGYQYFVEGREKREMKKLFGQYVSRDVYDQLVANPALARLGGQRREMTVLFSDIRGFTTVSERGQPEDIVHLLNEYFTRMVEIVFHHKGTVDKFVGDMVMALFGAPLDDPHHADHAVEAALDMIAELERLNARWEAHGRPRIDIGIGINTGPMIAGNIGSEQIMSYTVIGDAVNLGSRLESLNKQYGTHIIISDATRARLTGAYTFRPLGDVVVKGKTQPVAIFELVGRATPPADPSIVLRPAEPAPMKDEAGV
ncbi:MAG TPA: adenylate/guanylate cyclase domain-containing protein [Vicinamibacterales bacterium]|nr:adenylate/guanylate cyclase domain-containing protein [Vicinamibacterales bacterium]